MDGPRQPTDALPVRRIRLGAGAGRPGAFEFHVSRRSREAYGFDEGVFSQSGNVVLASFHAARLFAQSMNRGRDLVRFPETAARAGEIYAMGLIDEILHRVVSLYHEQRNPRAMEEALARVEERLGRGAVDGALRRFAEEFPPLAVYRREIGLDEYLAGETDGVPNRQLVLEEMLMLWIANANPALAGYAELFDDTDLQRETSYLPAIAALREYFSTQPPFGPDDEPLVELLRAPARAAPNSLQGQLEYIRRRWGAMLGRYLYRLLGGLDLLQEEARPAFAGPGPALVYDYRGLELEAERFSADREWMPSLVLIAKNTYVWLDQLSRRYGRRLTRLDEIPDEELDTLARWGISGLWLIGLWERSPASRRIKQLRGNPEAEASAYSLYDYAIAADLGGEGAYRDLRDRAWRRGIRLASDMVPNHMGIDSPWVVEHPDWFIQLDHSPFPSYTFGGPNLSWDERVGIYLEDHYYDGTDAAVVFRRVDHWTGDARYIYHGNDGTSMPWNDTAQLNYLLPDVREAVIRTILHVARLFPIIRFDAAMTLAKKHFQRLWFPEPGGGGAIPSRAEHAMTRQEFDAAFPEEFWRTVVDRVAQEVPDTLLLAEAFWLMEGYFVRTLGMHRVYNSAFMNMLRDERNQEYRLVIKNTIEFDPEILKRYVNFMNNPDERTAVDQFGKGDKYFGICTMMATMPGLPMFGHGQVEGYAEKYGMEFRRAYWDEAPDPYLVERHEREIFPLLRRRHLFAEAAQFLLYDYVTGDGHVNEDVYAYSNRAGDERSLVIYHNAYAETSGWIRESAAFKDKGEGGDRLVRRTLGEGLGLPSDGNCYVLFRDHAAGLEYLRNCREIHERGLYTELRAYQYHVFLDFREVWDDESRRYEQLHGYLGGRGVPSVEEALQEILLQPILDPFRDLVAVPTIIRSLELRERLADPTTDPAARAGLATLLDEVRSRTVRLLRAIDAHTGAGRPDDALSAIADEVARRTEVLLTDRQLADVVPVGAGGVDATGRWATLLAWAFTHRLGRVVPDGDAAGVARSWLDEWLLDRHVAGVLGDLGLDKGATDHATRVLGALVSRQDWARAGCEEPAAAVRILEEWLADPDVQAVVGVNRWEGDLWFNREAFTEFLGWMLAVAIVDVRSDQAFSPEEADERVRGCAELIDRLRAAVEESGYRVEGLLDAVKQ